MTYKLPFGLKQKPIRKYFEGGSIGFSCRDAKLYQTITFTYKDTGFAKETLPEREVLSKQDLDKLLAAKNANEIRALEMVTQ